MILDLSILALPIPPWVSAPAVSKPRPRQSRTRRSYVPAAQPIQFQQPKKPQQKKKDRNRPLSPTRLRTRPGRKPDPYITPWHLRNLGTGLHVRVAEIKRRHGKIKPARAAFEATREASQELLPRPQRGGSGVTPAQEDGIIERAIHLGSMIQGETETDRRLAETDRRDQYRCVLRRLFKTYDPAKARDIHATEADYLDADSSLRGAVPNVEIDEMRAKVRRHASMTRDQMRDTLAVVYVNGTVDAITDGTIPTLAIKRALKQRGMSDHGTLVDVCMEKLEELDRWKCTDPRFWDRHSRRWIICGATLSLPIVVAALGRTPAAAADEAVNLEAREAAKQIVDRHNQPYWGEPFPSTTSFIPSLPSHQQSSASSSLLNQQNASKW